jgi:hypothetical protein
MSNFWKSLNKDYKHMSNEVVNGDLQIYFHYFIGHCYLFIHPTMF